MSAPLPRPRRVYGTLAAAEMVTWTLLIVGMVATYLLDAGHMPVRVGGGVHGFVFLAYVLVTLVVAVDQRWPVRDLALGLASAVVPYATVPFERSAERRDLLGDRWRLLEAGAAAGLAGRLVAAGLRRPVLAVLVGLVAVVGVFVLMLALGPPTQWFAAPEQSRPLAEV
ncbi:DUF3817 domain-containing protein [Ornithinimicrobium kibberense]|uniref:DUF3817 domain-containing protein n=2 Tax=Ornithinimicrobium kibberense TaxID=282060 RepID=A0ABV5V4B3_9MICO|nr:DUF3817 domain-containing protein [Ornithinimicrobium kibberense]